MSSSSAVRAADGAIRASLQYYKICITITTGCSTRIQIIIMMDMNGTSTNIIYYDVPYYEYIQFLCSIKK